MCRGAVIVITRDPMRRSDGVVAIDVDPPTGSAYIRVALINSPRVPTWLPRVVPRRQRRQRAT